MKKQIAILGSTGSIGTQALQVIEEHPDRYEAYVLREIAQNTYLSRERCQLILTQLVMAGLADYQFGCYRHLQS